MKTKEKFHSLKYCTTSLPLKWKQDDIGGSGRIADMKVKYTLYQGSFSQNQEDDKNYLSACQ
jgi:hypothetical protein